MAQQQAKGKLGEDLAAEYLLQKGYTLLHRNWRNSRQEIDIIAQTGDILVFVEVKARSSSAFGAPQDFVDYKKEAHLEKASLAYLENSGHNGEIRFDIIAIQFNKKGKADIQHIEDAFFPYGD